MEKQDKKLENSQFGAQGYCMAIFLFILFINSVGLYGLKFAAGVALSWLTGGAIWGLRLLFQSGDDPEGVDKPFCWFLFLLFPLFIPLALPLWLIPTILIITYLISVSAFGGHGKQIFNPVIVAVVFMIYGYSHIGLTEASRPFPSSKDGYLVWTSGIPPKSDIRDIYSTIPKELAFSASLHGSIPTIPGSCFASIILIFSLLYSILFNRRRIWWIVSIVSICIFAHILPQPNSFNIPPTNLLFLGILPSLLLSGVADATTISESIFGQTITAIVFAGFAVFITYNSSNILAPAYAFLLTQVFSPLIIDIFGKNK